MDGRCDFNMPPEVPSKHKNKTNPPQKKTKKKNIHVLSKTFRRDKGYDIILLSVLLVTQMSGSVKYVELLLQLRFALR